LMRDTGQAGPTIPGRASGPMRHILLSSLSWSKALSRNW